MGSLTVTGNYTLQAFFSVRRFRPPTVIVVVFLVLFPAFVGLGSWQLGRAAEKDVLFEQFQEGEKRLLAEAPATPAAVSEDRYQVLRLEGRFDSRRQVLLDAMVLDGFPGYHVLTPFASRDGSRVLVNRGWIAAPKSRGELPDVTVSEAPRSLLGRIDELPRPGLRLAQSEAEFGAAWPKRMLFPTIADVEAELGEDLLPFQLLLAPTEAAGFERRWAPRVMAPERHRGYALQWFTFAAVTVLGFIAFGLAGGKAG